MFRWFALAVFIAALGISAWRRWLARRQMGSIPRGLEPPLLIAGRVFVAVPLFGGVVAYVANPGWMAWASVSVPFWVRWLGVALGVLTVPTIHWVLATLGANVSETILTKEHQTLVTAGPYRWVRHPLYSAGVALFLSIGLIAANWFIVLWATIAVMAVRLLVVPREEAQLVLKFGNDYRLYQSQTGSMMPPLRGNRNPQRAG